MDILKFAIEMEQKGEKYYKEQAVNNRNNSLHAVFTALANDERDHARILKDKTKGLPRQFSTSIISSAQSVFDGIKEFKIDIKGTPEQIDVYRLALEKEKQSITMYENLLSEAKEDKDLFEFLIAQEKQHYKIIELIVQMISRPSEWVEAAEFGNREEY